MYPSRWKCLEDKFSFLVKVFFIIMTVLTLLGVYSKGVISGSYGFDSMSDSSNQKAKLEDEKLKMICYYNFPNNLGDLQPGQIPENLCTHIILAFAGINQSDYTIHIPQNDTEVVQSVTSLRQKNKELKIIISVGGGGSNDFNNMSLTHASRKLFINSTMKFIKKFKLDGVDLDWEWPSSDGNYKEVIKFVQLLQEFREEFDRHKKKYILSISAGALQSQVEIYYKVNYIVLYVDFISLMTYDYHFYTPYYPLTDHNAPLFPSAKDENSIFANLNVNYSVNYWVFKSMPRNKIMLGLPAFGHTYKLVSSLNHGLHAPANGFGIGDAGFIKYNEVCAFLKLPYTFHERDYDALVPYAYNQYDWISFDDVESIRTKAEFIVKEKLGGAMLYSLNSEDYSGVCSNDGTKFPLLRTVRLVFDEYRKKEVA